MSHSALAVLLALLLGAAPGAARRAPRLADLRPPANPEVEEAWATHRAALGELGGGFVVWESNRSGSWRIWSVRLDGTGLRQLTPDEEGKDHIAPHISPDGKALAYMAVRAPHKNFAARRGMSGDLRVLRLADPAAAPREFAPDARPYNQNRAVVWVSGTELIYIAADGSTRLHDLANGEEVALTVPSLEPFGFLLNASRTHATSGAPTFSLYRASDRTVAERKRQRGCQPYFTHDGRFGFWVGGSGGPFRTLELASRMDGVLLEKRSRWLPSGHGYIYYPMVSRGGSALVFGSSRDQHGHFDADFDIFVAPLDPQKLEVNGTAVRLTFDPGQDRFPDIHLESEAGVAAPVAPELPAGELVVAVDEHSEALARDRIFVWQNERSENLILDPKSGLETAVEVEPRGRGRTDSQGRLDVRGGSFVAEVPTPHLGTALRGPDGFALELVADPTGRKQDDATLVSLGNADGKPVLFLSQRGRAFVLHVQTSAGEQQLALGQLGSLRNLHLVIEVGKGRVGAFRNGERVADAALIGDLSAWPDDLELVLGADPDGNRDWRGALEGVALYHRTLSPEEAHGAARVALTKARGREPVPRYRVRARLKSTSVLPTIEQIAPYREALVLNEYKVLQGELRGKTVRIAHWAILDGTPQAPVLSQVGQKGRLVLERWEHNPQVESTFVSDTLEPSSKTPLFLDVTS
jgi:hypothetical protein